MMVLEGPKADTRLKIALLSSAADATADAYRTMAETAFRSRIRLLMLASLGAWERNLYADEAALTAFGEDPERVLEELRAPCHEMVREVTAKHGSAIGRACHEEAFKAVHERFFAVVERRRDEVLATLPPDDPRHLRHQASRS